jgi:hypothetical protein
VKAEIEGCEHLLEDPSDAGYDSSVVIRDF